MDPLTQLLVQRAVQGSDMGMGADQTVPTPTTPPTSPTKVPQREKRFSNALQIQDAYRNGWSPNPVLLRAQLGHK